MRAENATDDRLKKRWADEFGSEYNPEAASNGTDGIDDRLDGSGRCFGRLVIVPAFRLEALEILDAQDRKDLEPYQIVAF